MSLLISLFQAKSYPPTQKNNVDRAKAKGTKKEIRVVSVLPRLAIFALEIMA